MEMGMQILPKGYGTYYSVHHLLPLRGAATSLSLLPSPLSLRLYQPPSSSSKPMHKKQLKLKKKKEKERSWKRKKNGGGASHGYEFDQLMLTWDEVFLRCCQDPAVTAAVRDASRLGLASHGRGCVLVCESIRTKPRGASSGFTHKLRKNAREAPSYDTLQRSISYVPRDFLLNLANVPEEDGQELDPTEALEEDNVRGGKESRHEAFDCPEVKLDPTEALEEDIHKGKESRHEVFDCSEVKLNLDKVSLEEDMHRGKESRHEAFDCSKPVKINPNKAFEDDMHRDEESRHEVVDYSEVKVDLTNATEVKANLAKPFDCLEVKLDSMEALLEEPRNVKVKKERDGGKTEANELVLGCESGGVPNNSGELIQHMQGDNAYESLIGTNATMKEDEMKVFLSSRSTLMSILGRIDRTRLLGVTRDINFSQGRNQRLKIADMDTMDAGGEDPYDPKKDELVLMLSVEVDGQQAVGADILLASINADSENGTSSWKLELRNPL